MTFNPLTSARDRALQLAKTGGYKNWPEIAGQLVREGYGSVSVRALGGDVSARAVIDEVVLQTIDPMPSAPKSSPPGHSVRTAPTRARRAADVRYGHRKALKSVPGITRKGRGSLLPVSAEVVRLGLAHFLPLHEETETAVCDFKPNVVSCRAHCGREFERQARGIVPKEAARG